MSHHMVKEIHILRVERIRGTISPSITPPQGKETHEKGTKIHTSTYTQLESSKHKSSSWRNHHL